MIANITQGNFVKGLLAYHTDKIKKGEAKVFMANAIVSNIPKVIENVLSSYNINSNRKDKNFHVSLNFKEEDYDTLTEIKQQEIIKDYMFGIGFPKDHPFVAYLHTDKKHPHFHIVTSKILENGKALKDSYLFLNSQRLTRKLEKSYNLVQLSSDKKEKQFKPIISTLKETEITEIYKSYVNQKIELNNYLTQVINFSIANYKPTNLIDLKKKLKEFNVDLSTTNHKTKGIVFRTADDTSSISASNLNPNYLYKNLEAVFKENKQEAKEHTKDIAKSINYLFYKYDTLNLSTYKKELAKQNINLIINQTNGVVRGFAYNYKGYRFKGQDLPARKYTMGKIKHKFAKQDKYSDIYLAKYLFKKNEYLLDYTDYQTFIKSALKANLKPTILGSSIYLIPLKSKEFDLNNTNSIEITTFSKEINALSFQDKQEINTHIVIYIEKLINKEEMEEMEEMEEEKTNLLNNIFNDLTNGVTGDDEEFPIEKKKKKRKKL